MPDGNDVALCPLQWNASPSLFLTGIVDSFVPLVSEDKHSNSFNESVS
jgi:hypothetical protein